MAGTMLEKIRNRSRPWSIAWLTLMWIGLMGEFTWGNLVAGLLLGLVITLLLPLPPMPTGGINVNVAELLKFFVRWIGQTLVAAVSVSWLAIRREEPPKGAIFTVPMRLGSELELYFATCAYNLQPGGCVTDIDLANRMWTIHVINADTQKDIKRALADVDKLERSMIAIFEKGTNRRHG